MDKKGKKSEEKKEKEPDKENLNEKESLERILNQGKQLKIVFISIAGLLILFFLVYLIIGSLSKFNYEGVKFKIVKESKLIFYNTALPYKTSVTGDVIGNYNFYIRNDPRKLKEEVPFNGAINLKKNIVINGAENFSCDGDGIIAVENLRIMLEVMGATVIRDKNATCDELGRYTYILLQSKNETSIDQYTPSCYNINVNNCEILKATERFMTETFVKFNEQENPSLVLSSSEINN
jgi:hypothetical protein